MERSSTGGPCVKSIERITMAFLQELATGYKRTIDCQPPVLILTLRFNSSFTFAEAGSIAKAAGSYTVL